MTKKKAGRKATCCARADWGGGWTGRSDHGERARSNQDLLQHCSAFAFVGTEGTAGFTGFRKPNGEWRFGPPIFSPTTPSSACLFAYTKLNVLLNAAFPKRKGQNMHSKTDVNGKPMHDDMLQVAQTKGSGWKVTVDGTPGVLSAGFYPE